MFKILNEKQLAQLKQVHADIERLNKSLDLCYSNDVKVTIMHHNESTVCVEDVEVVIRVTSEMVDDCVKYYAQQSEPKQTTKAEPITQGMTHKVAPPPWENCNICGSTNGLCDANAHEKAAQKAADAALKKATHIAPEILRQGINRQVNEECDICGHINTVNGYNCAHKRG